MFIIESKKDLINVRYSQENNNRNNRFNSINIITPTLFIPTPVNILSFISNFSRILRNRKQSLSQTFKL